MKSLKERFGIKPKEDPKSLSKIPDIEQMIKEGLEQMEGIKIDAEGDRIKNFFNGKFLRSMKKELVIIERHVHDVTKSQKDIIESLDQYIERIKKKFEERADMVKNTLFEALLGRSIEVSTRYSDLTISSTQLQKKIVGVKNELTEKGSVLKTSVSDFVKSFETYRGNLIRILEEDLAEGAIDRICSRMDTQTQKCIFQLDKLMETNLSPNQIFTTIKAETINVTALEMLDLDDTRSTTNPDDDDYMTFERKLTSLSLTLPANQFSLKQVTQANLHNKILDIESIETHNLAAVSLEESDEIVLFSTELWDEVCRAKCSANEAIKLVYHRNKQVLFAILKDQNVDVFKIENSSSLILFKTLITNKPVKNLCCVGFLDGIAICYEDSTIEIYKDPNYEETFTIEVSGEESVGAIVAIEAQKLLLSGSAKDGMFRLIDPVTKSVVKSIQLSSTSVCQLNLAGATNNIMVGNRNGVFELLLVKDKGVDQVISLGNNEGAVSSIAWCSDDKLFGITNCDEYVRLFDSRGKLVHKYKAFMDGGIVVYFEKTRQYACVDLSIGQILILNKAT